MLESDTNRAFIGAAGRRIVLADHTKWGVTGLSSFAELSDADVLVTDDRIAPEAVEILNDSIEQVMMVDAERDHDDHDHHNHHHSVRSA